MNEQETRGERVVYPDVREGLVRRADLDAAILRERAALGQATIARQSLYEMGERARKAEARTAELERELAELNERIEKNQQWQEAMLSQRDQAREKVAELERTAHMLAGANFKLAKSEAVMKRERDEAREKVAEWQIVANAQLHKTIEMQTQRDEARAHAARLAALMQEATANCETCRGEKDGCARCASFRVALSATPASALALWRSYEVEHRLGETVEDGLGREDPECNCDECNWIRVRAAVEDAEADIETARPAIAEIERNVFERGARAMRELIAADMSDELADHIRNMPIPEMGE